MALIGKLEKWKVPTYNNYEEIQLGEVAFDYEKCNGCLLCIKICPADALEKNDKRPVMVVSRGHECMACGDCGALCSENAITVKRSFQCLKGLYKTIEQGELLPPRL